MLCSELSGPRRQDGQRLVDNPFNAVTKHAVISSFVFESTDASLESPKMAAVSYSEHLAPSPAVIHHLDELRQRALKLNQSLNRYTKVLMGANFLSQASELVHRALRIVRDSSRATVFDITSAVDHRINQGRTRLPLCQSQPAHVQSPWTALLQSHSHIELNLLRRVVMAHSRALDLTIHIVESCSLEALEALATTLAPLIASLHLKVQPLPELSDTLDNMDRFIDATMPRKRTRVFLNTASIPASPVSYTLSPTTLHTPSAPASLPAFRQIVSPKVRSFSLPTAYFSTSTPTNRHPPALPQSPRPSNQQSPRKYQPPPQFNNRPLTPPDPPPNYLGNFSFDTRDSDIKWHAPSWEQAPLTPPPSPPLSPSDTGDRSITPPIPSKDPRRVAARFSLPAQVPRPLYGPYSMDGNRPVVRRKPVPGQGLRIRT